MSIVIEPIIHNGEHYVRVVMDGCPMEPRGPFSADQAEIVACRIAAISRALNQSVVINGCLLAPPAPMPAAVRKR